MSAHRPGLSGWEIALIALILLAGAWSTYLSPYYLTLDQILYSTRQFLIPGLLALGLMVVVVTGEIDISLCSTLAVGAVIFSKLSAVDVPIWLAVPPVVMACSALGAFNGVLVARFRLPSLAVTLGTMGAYRGLAFILAGGDAYTGYTNFNDSYLYVGSELVSNLVPVSLIVLAIVSLFTAFLVHRTLFGRRCFAIGNNKDAAWISGINVTRVKIEAYTFAGAMSALAALVWIGQYGSARGDNADSMILFIVTAVVLGGVEITGGAGSVLGVLLSLILLGTLRNGMGLANIGGPVETVVFGALLVVGVLRPAARRLISHAARRRGAADLTLPEKDDLPAKNKWRLSQASSEHQGGRPCSERH